MNAPDRLLEVIDGRRIAFDFLSKTYPLLGSKARLQFRFSWPCRVVKIEMELSARCDVAPDRLERMLTS